jgi:hypothetical protein
MGASECGADELTSTGRAAMNQILGRAREVASALLRPLFRDIGSETVLDQLENDRSGMALSPGVLPP